jgi:hypothetical protein
MCTESLSWVQSKLLSFQRCFEKQKKNVLHIEPSLKYHVLFEWPLRQEWEKSTKTVWH